MSLLEILILSAIGVALAFLWFTLIRASVRRGRCCRTDRCKVGTSAAKEAAAERKDG